MSFDGRTWERHDLPEEPNGRHPNGIEATDDGTIWVSSLTLNHGFMAWNGRTWRHVVAPTSPRPAPRIRDFKMLSRDGDVVVMTVDGGLQLRLNGEWSTTATLVDGHVVNDIELAGGILYVATSGGVSTLREGVWDHDLLAAVRIPDNAIYAVARDLSSADASGLWLLGADWIGRLEDDTFQLLADDVPLKRSQVGWEPYFQQPAVSDGDDGLWLSNHYGVAHFSTASGMTMLGPHEGLAAGWATALLRDRDGNTWMTSVRGITRIPTPRFANYGVRQGLWTDEVIAIVEHPPGRIILGHVDGLTFIDGDEITTRELPSGPNQSQFARVLDLAVDRDGGLWIARTAFGVTHLGVDGEQQDFEIGPPSTNVYGVLVDDAGDLWLGTSVGVFRRRGEAFNAVDIPTWNGAATSVRRVFQLSDGRIALATSVSGLLLQEEGSWRRLLADRDSGNTVYGVIKTGDRLLVGTTAGVFEAVSDSLVQFEADGLMVHEPVYSLLEDSSGRLWCGTQNGVIRWDASGAVSRRYSLDEGLAGQETNRAATLLDSAGRLWFGTVNGLSRYQPAYDQVETPSLPLELIAVEVEGEWSDAAADRELPASSNDLAFHFRAISFADGGHIDYRCRLEGFSDWLTGDELRDGLVRYTNVPAGSYRFHVEARRRGQDWSARRTSGQLVIRRHFWRTPWFIAAMACAALALVLGVSRFIGERRRATMLDRIVHERTAELRDAEERYREIFDKNRLPQLLIDRSDNLIIAANPAAVEFYRLQHDQLVGRSFATLHDAAAPLPTDLQELTTATAVSFAARHRLGSGETRDVEVYTCAYELQGRQVAQATVCDVSERHELQRQLLHAQKMESIGRLAGGIAHDFNNLLTAVIGHADVASLDDELPASTRDHLAEVKRAGKRGAQLTEQLLGFARLQFTQPRVVDINEQLRRMYSVLRRVIREEVEIIMVLGSDVGDVEIDPGQVEQILLNLAVNASDAMRGPGCLTLETAPIVLSEAPLSPEFGRLDLRPGRYVMLAVTDTGTGMDRATQSRIFEPFFTTKEVGKGTGLGLATCHGIARQNDGDILVHSQLGVGTTFKVLLPRADGEAAPIAPDSGHDATRNHGQETVLLVEDDDAVRHVVATALRQAEYTVLEASGGHDADSILLHREDAVDLLLTDVIMPGEPGPELFERLRAHTPSLRVLFMSGYPANALKSHGWDVSRLRMLHKPFMSGELARAVREVLDEPDERARI